MLARGFAEMFASTLWGHTEFASHLKCDSSVLEPPGIDFLVLKVLMGYKYNVRIQHPCRIEVKCAETAMSAKGCRDVLRGLCSASKVYLKETWYLL